jgi:hypothetical protein
MTNHQFQRFTAMCELIRSEEGHGITWRNNNPFLDKEHFNLAFKTLCIILVYNDRDECGIKRFYFIKFSV